MKHNLFVVSVYSPFNWKKPLSWISWGIRKVTRFHWHHSAFLVYEEDNWFIIESDTPGVVKTKLDEWLNKKEIQLHKLPEEIYNKEYIYQKISQRIGNTPYDYRSLLFHHVLNQVFGIWIGPRKPGKAYERFTCSEFVAWGLEWEDAYKVNPKTIYERLLEGSVWLTGKSIHTYLQHFQ